MITLFIFLSMLFFLYAGIRILISKNANWFDKFFVIVGIGAIELYYLLQLIERL